MSRWKGTIPSRDAPSPGYALDARVDDRDVGASLVSPTDLPLDTFLVGDPPSERPSLPSRRGAAAGG